MFLALSSAVFSDLSDREILSRALDLIGGENAARALRAVSVKGIASFGLNEQSERYTGPVLLNHADFDAKLDFAGSRVSGDFKFRGAQFEKWIPMKVNSDFSSENAGRQTSLMSPTDLRDLLRLNPTRILLYAKQESKLVRMTSVREGTEKYERIKFAKGNDVFTLWFRKNPGNLDRIEQQGPRDLFWAAWKDVRSTVKFSNWQLLPGGAYFPHSLSETRNGNTYGSWTITEARPENGEPVADEDLQKEQSHLAFKPATFDPPLPKLVQIAPNLWQYPGMFPSEVVESGNDLYILDAPYGQSFCDKMVKDIQSKFPGKAISGVVLTDPYWPHQAGFIVFAKMGVPVYTEARNTPLIREFVDNWKIKERFSLKGISTRFQIGEGCQVHPMEGVVSERFLNIYLPKQKILFCSDSISWSSKTTLYNPAGAADVLRLVEREALDVDSVFATHASLIPLSKIREALKPQGN